VGASIPKGLNRLWHIIIFLWIPEHLCRSESENDILSNCLLFLLLYVYYCVYIFIKKRKSGLNDQIDLEAMNKPESYAN
jgi:hypothetical protein